MAATSGACASDPIIPSEYPTPVVTESELPMLAGVELDRALRAGAADDSGLPPFGRLLAATQTDGPRTIRVDLHEVAGPVISVYNCRGKGGVTVSLRRNGKSLHWVKSDGCNPTFFYIGQSPPVGRGGVAELAVEAAAGVQFSLVLEEVAS